jgi:hypothetical protein
MLSSADSMRAAATAAGCSDGDAEQRENGSRCGQRLRSEALALTYPYIRSIFRSPFSEIDSELHNGPYIEKYISAVSPPLRR